MLFETNAEGLEGSFLTNHFSTDKPTDKVKSFVTNYKKLFNLDPDSFAALGYDSLYILTEAIKRANSTEKAVLQKAMAQTRDFVGVTGKLNFNAYREVKKEVIMLKIKNQNFTYHSAIQP
ncbi:MAG: ABC transporter substrate-binding protein [Pyrinomonadaceae bacterium]|nr:ABC transporter substrate-binding protein [Pyrinomonadaceae bacterium]